MLLAVCAQVRRVRMRVPGFRSRPILPGRRSHRLRWWWCWRWSGRSLLRLLTLLV